MVFQLPLRVPLSPTEISLDCPVVLNDTEWYSMVYHWLFFVRVDLLQIDKRRRADGLQAIGHQYLRYAHRLRNKNII